MRATRAIPLALFVAGCAVVASPRPSSPRPSSPPSEPVTDLPTRQVTPISGPEVPTGQPARPFEEVRALWVVRSTMTSAAEVTAMVEQADQAGFNTVLVQVRGRADAFYSSSWEPRGETITEADGFDPLALTIDLAHARGIAVHAWVNTHLVWGGAGPAPRDSRHIVRAHPEWLAVPRALSVELFDVSPWDPIFVERLRKYAADNSGTVEGVYTSPSDARVKERVRSVWLDLASRYDLDGIHFDYIRFPSGDFDYSRGALERFRRWVTPRLSPGLRAELAAAHAGDPLAYVDALSEPWAEFRRKHVTELVRWVYHGIKARRPELVVSAAVFSNQEDAFRNRYQDWPAWLEEGILDVAVPMAYTTDDDRFRAQIREGVAVAGKGRLWAGVGAYLNSHAGTLTKIDIAREEATAGVVLFSYDWAVGDGYDGPGPTLLEVVGRTKFGGGRP